MRGRSPGLPLPLAVDAAERRRAEATHVRGQAQLEADLRRALERGEPSASCPPIVDLGCGRLAGFEALSRWSHPSRGPVAPQEFAVTAMGGRYAQGFLFGPALAAPEAASRIGGRTRGAAAC